MGIKKQLLILSFCLPLQGYASSLLVPSLEEEIWINAKPSLKKEAYVDPPLSVSAPPSIPQAPTLFAEPALGTNNSSVSETENSLSDNQQIDRQKADDLLAEGLSAEPNLRAASPLKNTQIPSTGDNVFTQTDTFFSLIFDASNQKLSDENIEIIEQIIESTTPTDGVEITLPPQPSPVINAKISQLMQRLDASAITKDQILTKNAQGSDTAILQKNSVLVMIKQKTK